MTGSRLARYQLPIFFILAFAITWPAQIAVYTYAHNHGHTVTNGANVLAVAAFLRGDLDPGYLPFLLLFMFSFGPTVAGIVVTALFKRRAGLVNLWRRTTRVRIPSGWIGLIVVLPVLLGVASVALGFVLGGHAANPLLVPRAAMVVCTGPAEELGWRGYALPELETRYTAERSSWILGILWGLWHIPSNLFAPLLRGDLTPVLVVPILAASPSASSAGPSC